MAFTNPLLGVLVGAVLTAIIQSSSASVGILQALASTGQVSYAAAVPIIMGQNIGTCVTALISCVGTNKNAKRAAVVHLMFNVIGVAVLLTVFCIVKAIFAPVLLNKAASMAGIAVAHSVFNILCTAILLPCGDLLEKLAIRLVPDKAHAADKTVELDQRLLTTPAVALERCRVVTCEMAEAAVRALQNALRSFDHYTEALASAIREDESRCDHYEDVLGTYLVKLSAQKLGEQESEESAELLKAIGDFERISDHAVNVLESAEELREKGLAFSDEAKRELSVLSAAVNDILMRALDAFRQQDMTAARQVEPLEQVIDDLKEQLRTRHILRMQQGQCSIGGGLCLVRPADGSGAYLGPLLQYRRVRDRRRSPRPEYACHAGCGAAPGPGLPGAVPTLRGEISGVNKRSPSRREGLLLMRLQPAGGALPRLGLRPLAADLHPVGQLVQLGGKGCQLAGDVDLLGTDSGAGTAAQTGVRPLVRGHRVQLHLDGAAAAGAELVVLVQQIRDIQLLGTAVTAVAAGSAGDGILHLIRRSKEDRLPQRGERGQGARRWATLSAICAMSDIPERTMWTLSSPWSQRKPKEAMLALGRKGVELLFTVGIQGGQLAAADRLHDPDGDMVLFQQLVFLPGPLDGPVQIVQLDLTELHLLAIALQKSGEAGKVRVGGEAQVLDTAQALLFHKVVDDAPPGVGVNIHIVFIDVVQQVEIEVVHLTLLQLLGKGVRRVRVAGERMAGVFGGQVKLSGDAFSGSGLPPSRTDFAYRPRRCQNN